MRSFHPRRPLQAHVLGPAAVWASPLHETGASPCPRSTSHSWGSFFTPKRGRSFRRGLAEEELSRSRAGRGASWWSFFAPKRGRWFWETFRRWTPGALFMYGGAKFAGLMAEPKSIYRDPPRLGLLRPIVSSADLIQDVTYFARRLRDFLFAKSGKAE